MMNMMIYINVPPADRPGAVLPVLGPQSVCEHVQGRGPVLGTRLEDGGQTSALVLH